MLIAAPERAPKALLADKGYDAAAIRTDLASRNIQAVIPGRSNQRWLGKSAQQAKWNFCLKAARMAVEQEIR